MRATQLVSNLAIVLAAAGCSGDGGGGDDLDCEAIAIRTDAGAPDPCDVDACNACVDTCGGDCVVLESYPPRYSCGADGSWAAYDECPDWSGTTNTPFAKDVTDLGCGTTLGESLVATVDGPSRAAVMHTDAVLGCCPTDILVDVTKGPDATLTVAYTLLGDVCECACGIDVSYDLLPLDAGDWTIVAAESGTSTTVTMP